MFRKFWRLFLVLVIEGASLMAVEIMGAKFLAPFYGSSLYVWTAILAITVLGLSAGYYIGGRISTRKSIENRLLLILGAAALLVFAMPYTAGFSIAITSSLPLIPGICVASLLLVVPPVLLFGLVGPIVVRLMSERLEKVGDVAGTTYFTSTCGGIVATFLFGYVLIPEVGLKASALITGIALALLPLVYFLKGSRLKAQGSSKDEVISVKKKGASIEAKPIPKSFYWFAALEGATVMAVELMSARMLAPWFGSSLYVWVAVIGITLLSLAIGYYAGGRVAGKYPGTGTIYWVLLMASMFLMLMPYLSEHLTTALSGVDLRIGAVIVSLLFVLPPLVFLGMVPTLLIKYLTEKADHSGATTGTVFTISSVSGILALPLMGFLVIPQFGLSRPAIVIGMLVGMVPLVRLLSLKKYYSLAILPVMMFAFSQRGKAAASPDLKVLEFSEGLLGQVLVADVFKNGAGQATNDRFLFINRMGQTNIDTKTGNSRWNYIPFATSVASKVPENSRALLLGLGGGSAANMLHDKLKMRVDAIELDSRISDAARKYFALSSGVNIIIDDARHYLETTKEKYDLIFFDVFKGDIMPPHVLTVECFEKAKSLLNPYGLIIVNFHGFLSDEPGRPGRSVFTTLKAAGMDVRLLPTPGKEEDRNTLFVASVQPVDFHSLRSPLLHSGQAVDIDSLFLDPGTLQMNNARVFADDQPVLDRLNIKANTIWRKSYNGTYSKFFGDRGVRMFN